MADHGHRAGFAVSPLLGVIGHRRPDLGAEWDLESRRRHAHDLERFAIKTDGLADNVLIGVELSRPQDMREDNAAMVAGIFFFGREHTAEHRLHGERIEEVRCHLERWKKLGRIDLGEIRVPPLKRRQIGHGARRLFPFLEIQRRDRLAIDDLRRRGIGGDEDEAIDPLKTVRSKGEGVDQSIDRGIRGQCQPQRQCDDGGQCRPAADRTHRVPDIAKPASAPAAGLLEIGGKAPRPHQIATAEHLACGKAAGQPQRLPPVPGAGGGWPTPSRDGGELLAHVAADRLSPFRIANQGAQAALGERPADRGDCS